MSLREKIVIRPAAASDLDAIVSLWMEMMREHEEFDPRIRLSSNAADAYRNYARHYVERPDTAVFVADMDGEVVGFCLAYCARSLPMFQPAIYGFISDLAVAQPRRRRGIGGALLETVRRWFHDRGIANIQLQVYSRNTDGVAFWRKAGFDDFVHGLWLPTKD